MKTKHSIIVFTILYGIQIHARNQVLIQGHSKSYLIEDAVHFYTQYLEISPTINIVVQFTQNLPHHTHGATDYEKYETENGILEKVHIRIHEDLSKRLQEITLAHEMVHAMQYISGDLIRHGEGHIYWKGQHYSNLKWLKYQDRGWEKDAFHKETQLYKAFRKYLKHRENMSS